MRFAGIDPGLSGGVFIHDTNTEETFTFRFSGTDSKLNLTDLLAFLSNYNPEVVYLEKIFLAGREGGSSAMTIGSNYGRLTALLEILGFAYTEVTPRAWQSSLGLKTGSRAITKQAASDLAVKRFGLDTFLEGRAKKPHDGLTDAACMVLYAINKQAESLWDSEPKKRSKKPTKRRVFNTDTSPSKSNYSTNRNTTSSAKQSARSQTSATRKTSSKSKESVLKKNGTV